MTEIVIPKYQQITDDFEVIDCPGFTLKIEHSLLAISKWESKFKKPYLEQKEFTYDEFVYYVECMVLNPEDIPPDGLKMLTMDSAKEIQAFIEDKPSATVIKRKDDKPKANKRFTTSELIYAYMAQARIPYSAETWNIYRLLNVLEIISIDSNPDKKKVSKADTLRKYRAMNQARRAKRR